MDFLYQYLVPSPIFLSDAFIYQYNIYYSTTVWYKKNITSVPTTNERMSTNPSHPPAPTCQRPSVSARLSAPIYQCPSVSTHPSALNAQSPSARIHSQAPFASTSTSTHSPSTDHPLYCYHQISKTIYCCRMAASAFILLQSNKRRT